MTLEQLNYIKKIECVFGLEKNKISIGSISLVSKRPVDKNLDFNSKSDLLNFLSNVLKSVPDEIFEVYIGGSAKFGPIKMLSRELIEHLESLIEIDDEIFSLHHSGLEVDILVDIEKNLNDEFTAVVEISNSIRLGLY